MTERTPEYWAIMKDNFPQAHEDHAKEKAQRRELEQRAIGLSEEQRMRVQQASRDPRIADYLVHGDGDEAGLIAELQRDYNLLNEAEAIIALNEGLSEQYDKWVGYDET